MVHYRILKTGPIKTIRWCIVSMNVGDQDKPLADRMDGTLFEKWKRGEVGIMILHPLPLMSRHPPRPRLHHLPRSAR